MSQGVSVEESLSSIRRLIAEENQRGDGALELSNMVAPPSRPAMPRAEEEPIASGSTLAVGAAALSELRAQVPHAAAAPQAIGNPGITLEDIVRSELRPMLQAWLDANLPEIVERLVQNEVRRISRRGGGP